MLAGLVLFNEHKMFLLSLAFILRHNVITSTQMSKNFLFELKWKQHGFHSVKVTNILFYRRRLSGAVVQKVLYKKTVSKHFAYKKHLCLSVFYKVTGLEHGESDTKNLLWRAISGRWEVLWKKMS